MLDCDCPRCGSKNTKALPLLYEGGTRTFTSRRNGLFYYRGSIGLHASNTRGESQTLTARRAAPPESLQFSVGAVAIMLLIGLFVAGITGFWIAFSVLIALAVIVAVGSKGDEEERKAWSSTFRCNQCATVFSVMEESTTATGIQAAASDTTRFSQRR
jgi:hypothetical protein